MAGVSVQLAGYLLFDFVFLSFWHRVRKNPPPHYDRYRVLLWAVFFSSQLIILRSIFRVIEMGVGWNGVINNTEWCLYVFDGAFVFVAVAIMNVVNPMQYLPKDFSWKYNPDREDAYVSLYNDGEDWMNHSQTTLIEAPTLKLDTLNRDYGNFIE